MFASGPTTPGSGTLPMSTLWAGLPRELERIVFEKAVPSHLSANVDRRLLVTRPARLLTHSPQPWVDFFTILMITKDHRQRALACLKRQSVIHISCDEPAARLYIFKRGDWLEHCGQLVVEVRRYINVSTPGPRSPGCARWSKSRLEALWSGPICEQSQKSVSSVQWSIQLQYPTREEILFFKAYIEDAELSVRSLYQKRVNRYPLWFYNSEWTTYDVGMAREAWKLLNSSVDEHEHPDSMDVVVGRETIEVGEVEEGFELAAWIVTSALQMATLAETLVLELLSELPFSLRDSSTVEPIIG